MENNKNDILKKLKILKKELAYEGFIIEGIFGSYARGDQNEKSDVDILYHLNQTFLDKNRGFIGFKKLNDIKKHISKQLGKKIDLAPKNNLSKTGEKYILNEMVYV